MDTGGKIRTGNILKQLAKLHEITVISNVESPQDDPYVQDMNQFCHDFIQVPWQETKRYTLKFFLKLSLQMFSPYPVSVLNTVSPDLARVIKDEYARGDYDLVICDFVQAALLMDKLDADRTLLFQHNVEAQIAKRHVEQAGNPISKLFWWLQWYKMDRYERAQCMRFDCVIAVSEEDKRQFEEQGCDSAVSIPTGTDIDFFKPDHSQVNPDQLVFCGSMDWLPNEDGMVFFIEEIFPSIKQRRPGAELIIVGRNPSPVVVKLAENRNDIQLTGWVDDTRPYLARAGVFIVPLRIGGGTRMKIFEAMAMGKAVLSTSIGAEGLPVTDGENIALEDNAAAFADRACSLMENSVQAIALGTNAREYVEDNFSWQQVARVFDSICVDTVNKEVRH